MEFHANEIYSDVITFHNLHIYSDLGPYVIAFNMVDDISRWKINCSICLPVKLISA